MNKKFFLGHVATLILAFIGYFCGIPLEYLVLALVAGTLIEFVLFKK